MTVFVPPLTKNVTEINSNNTLTADITQCTGVLLSIIPYADTPNGIPSFIIIPTIENIRDMYSSGVCFLIKVCTGTLSNMIATLNKKRIPERNTKYNSVPVPRKYKMCGNSKPENASIVTMSRPQPIIRGLETFFSFLFS
ncbi:hypothetical protein ACUH7Y_19575 [Clostridium beijerinckii]|uniref:Uncharacterized protein n=1 Tax=Clostridium beijerinckii TaxID=1520 RepID=A0A7X9XQ58_CLOBE|nr:hypothetical protein [Clostridium beijerinckii]NMF06227.1 hypothetical protein [Clostridium beijerinckii]